MTSEGLGKMFEGNFADTSGEKIPLMLMVGLAEDHPSINMRTSFKILHCIEYFRNLNYVKRFYFNQSLEIMKIGKVLNLNQYLLQPIFLHQHYYNDFITIYSTFWTCFFIYSVSWLIPIFPGGYKICYYLQTVWPIDLFFFGPGVELPL